jgi:hypothetical protein
MNYSYRIKIFIVRIFTQFMNSHPFHDIAQELRHYIQNNRHRREKTFQNSLEGYLKRRGYNHRNNYVINTELRPREYDINIRRKLDMEVDVPRSKNVAIELKHDFNNAGRLRDQIEEYRKVWSYIIVCSDGVADRRAWNDLLREYETSGGLMSQQEIMFIPGPQEERRSPQAQRKQQPRGNSGGIDWSDPFSYF